MEVAQLPACRLGQLRVLEGQISLVQWGKGVHGSRVFHFKNQNSFECICGGI